MYVRAPIRHLNLQDSAPVVAELAACPHLGRIRSMSLWRNQLGDHGLATLLSSPHLGRLRWLDLTGNQLTDASLEALAAARTFPDLRVLRFDDNAAASPVDEVLRDLDGSVLDIVATARGQQLEAVHGPLPWLHPPRGAGQRAEPSRGAV